MIELIIEPAPFLIDVMREKTAEQLVDLIRQSFECNSLQAVAIHLTATDILLQKFPDRYVEVFK